VAIIRAGYLSIFACFFGHGFNLTYFIIIVTVSSRLASLELMKDGAPATIPVTVRSGKPLAEIAKIVMYSITIAIATDFLCIQFSLKTYYIS
jgi:hypothetical protein